jgi:hypothetical protein
MDDDEIKILTLSELRALPLTIDALPCNTRAGTSQTVGVCAHVAHGFGRPCRVVLDAAGACSVHGVPANPQQVTVHSAWDDRGNRTNTHPMWAPKGPRTGG